MRAVVSTRARGRVGRGSVAVAIVGGVLAAGGCGSSSRAPQVSKAPNGSSVLAATAYAPTPDLTALITADARDAAAKVHLEDAPATSAAQLALLRKLAAPSSGLATLVVGAFDPARAELAIVSRKPGGPKVVSLLTPIRGAAAAIRLDERRVGAALARGAAAWAKAHGGIGQATVIAPPAENAIPDWSLSAGRRNAAAIEQALERTGFTVRVVRALGSADTPQALGSGHAPVTIGWNDTTALAAAAAGRGANTWVGAAGSPSPTGTATLDALRGGRLDLVVGARLADLAEAIVQVPLALQHGKNASTADLPVRRFTATSAATKAAAADYVASAADAVATAP